MKIAKATITALLYTSKTLANGEHPVMIRVCYNGKRKYKSTGLSCPAKTLEYGETGSTRTPSPFDEYERPYRIGTDVPENKVLDYERQGMAYSVQSLLEASGRKPPSRKNAGRPFRRAYRLFQGHPPETQHGHRLPDAAAYYRTVFQNRTVVELFDVDKAWLQDFEQHLHTRYADTSIKRFFSAFKALMNYACQSGQLAVSPFHGFRLSRRLDVRTAKGRWKPGNWRRSYVTTSTPIIIRRTESPM